MPQWAFAPGLRGGLERVGEVRARVPDAVADRLARVPVEPPVDHLAADARHRHRDGDVAGAVLVQAPAGLAGHGIGVEQAVELAEGERLAGVERARFDRAQERRLRRRDRPAQVALELLVAHRPIHSWKRRSGSRARAQLVELLQLLLAGEPRRAAPEVLVGELDAARQRLHRAHRLGRPGHVRAVERGVLPDRVERDVGVVLAAVGHVRPRGRRGRARPPVHPQHVRRRAGQRRGDPLETG